MYLGHTIVLSIVNMPATISRVDLISVHILKRENAFNDAYILKVKKPHI